MSYLLGLIIVLVLLWLGLSGHYTSLMLSFGVVAVFLSVLLAFRMRVLDSDASPYGRLPKIFVYWAWLLVEIVKANWIVIKACLRADLDINPAIVTVSTKCESDLARTTFANSITLTPGTVSMAIEGHAILVHALNAEDAGADAFEEMDRRAKWATDRVVKA